MGQHIVRLIRHGSPEYAQTVALRYQILRKPLGLEFTDEQLAAEVSDHHVACHRDGEIVGCLVLTPLEDGALKMRQVAVAGQAQRQGIGRAMVSFSESFAHEHGFDKIVLNARHGAVAFYQALDYELVGEPFEEVGIRHWKMRKNL